MTGLLYRFADVLGECDALAELAGDYIEPASSTILKEVRGHLVNVQTKGIESYVRWSIPPDRPLRSIPSVGESAPDGNGPYSLVAELSFVWELRAVKDRANIRPRHFALGGLTSTLVRILNVGSGGPATEIARWKVEVGDSQSPGTYFHIQLNGESDAPPFPKDLDVPRLPTIPMTPFLVFETVLAELFQDRWARTAFADNEKTRRWTNLQLARFEAFLNWQHAELAKAGTGTPWARLKRAKPGATLLVGEAS